MTDHKCSVEKLKVVWKFDGKAHKGAFTCPCGKEYSWEELVKLIPFKDFNQRRTQVQQ